MSSLLTSRNSFRLSSTTVSSSPSMNSMASSNHSSTSFSSNSIHRSSMPAQKQEPAYSSSKKVFMVIYATCLVLCLQGVFNILHLMSTSVTNPAVEAGGPGVPSPEAYRRKLMSEKQVNNGALTTTNSETSSTTKRRPPVRVLFGIFSTDTQQSAAYRWKFRELFQTFYDVNDYRVCNLWQLEQAILHKQLNEKLADMQQQQHASKTRIGTRGWKKEVEKLQRRLERDVEIPNPEQVYEQCSFVYTFVFGGNLEANAPTQIVSQEQADAVGGIKVPPMIVGANRVTRDVKMSTRKHKFGDVTLLNIQENMNAGKSQTWFYFGSTVADKLGVSDGIDYVAKFDADALPYLDLFFDWTVTQHRLPPAPYNTNILVGNPVDKYWWYTNEQNHTYTMKPHEVSGEDYWKHHYENHLHLYAQGQCYIMSIDLCKYVAKEATAIQEFKTLPTTSSSNTKKTHNKNKKDDSSPPQEDANANANVEPTVKSRYNYTVGHEDHDVSSMAFHSPFPIQFQLLTRYQKFWKHPIKNTKGVKLQDKWNTEIERMKVWVKNGPNHNIAMAGTWKDSSGVLHSSATEPDDSSESAEAASDSKDKAAASTN